MTFIKTYKRGRQSKSSHYHTTKMERTEYDGICNYLSQGSYEDNISKKQKRIFRKRCNKYFLEKSTLFYKRKGGNCRVVKVEDKERILYLLHDSRTAGHLGITRTLQKASCRYYWKGMSQDVKEYVLSCPKCQQSNPLKKQANPLHPIEVTGFLDRIGIDIVGKLPETSSKNKYIVVATEYATKWAEAAAIPDKSAMTVARFLYSSIICRFGCFKTLQSDQGSEFCNKVVACILELCGIRHSVSSAYHPQTNGLTERYNQTLCNSLQKYANKKQNDWDMYIDGCLFAYRTSVQESTKFSPYQLLYGREPMLPVEWEHPTFQNIVSREVAKESSPPSVQFLQQEALQNIKKAQRKQKDRHDSRLGLDILKVGDKVLMRNPKQIHRMGDKLAKRYAKMYTISEVKGFGVYKVRDELGNVLKRSVNISNLKRFKERGAIQSSTVNLSDGEIEDANDYFVVEDSFMVHKTSIATLEGQNWLNDEVLDAFIATSVKDTAYTFIPTYNTQIILSKLSHDASVLVAGLDAFNGVVVPLNIQNSHWVCLVFNFEQNSICFYDPMGSLPSQEILEAANTFRSLLLMESAPLLISEGCRQQDGYNCGVFVCHYIHYHCGKYQNQMCVPEEFRVFIKKTLIGNN